MASVVADIDIAAAPEFVWDAVADVAAVHQRLLPGRVADVRLEGDVRILTMPNGARIEEFIVAIDHDNRRMAYSVRGGQAMALTYHQAAFQVFATGDPGRSRLVWVTYILPHAMAGAVQARVERGILEMRDVIQAAAASA